MPRRPPNPLQLRIGAVIKQLLRDERVDPGALRLAVIAAAATMAIGKEQASIHGDPSLGPAAKYRFMRECELVWDELRAQTLNRDEPVPAPGETN